MVRHETIVVNSQLDTLFKVQQWFRDLYESLEPELAWVGLCRDRLNLAIAEGFTNAVRHAHAQLPPETPITIDVWVKGDRIDICIWDQGEPFDPDQLGEPAPGSLLQNGGYGWYLLRRVVDAVSYQRQADKNCLSITQYHLP